MKKIEIVQIDKFGNLKNMSSFNYSEYRYNKLLELKDYVTLFDIDDDKNKIVFLSKDIKMYGVIVWRGFIKQWMQEDWISEINCKK